MLLERSEAQLFFKLHRALMFFVNEQLHVLPNEIRSPNDFGNQPLAAQQQVRKALLDEVDLIGSFADQNPQAFSAEELEIVLSWKHLVAGRFFIFRELKRYTVFLSSEEDAIAYGVTALTQPFVDIVKVNLPILTETVLLPFMGKIIYDGLLSGPGLSLSFGPGVRRSLDESYQQAKDRYGIVTTLPLTDTPAVRAKKPASPEKRDTDEAKGVVSEIIGMIDQFCREHLNEEYAVLCRKLAEKLARKRPSPLLSGKPQTWACAIVRTIGSVNFLDDRTQSPHMKLTAIDKAFGVSTGTGQSKSKAIRDLLEIGPFEPEWTLPSRIDDNPLVWMLSVNGLMMDIRHAPRAAQERAFQQGLIPYIPADRANEQ